MRSMRSLPFSTLKQIKAVPKRVVASYVLDWIAILVIAGIGGALNSITPSHRLFSLVDLSISFPVQNDLIPTWLLIVASLVIPAVIVAIVVIVIVPGLEAGKRMGMKRFLIRKVWELNAGLMGLGLSLAIAFTITQAAKVMFSRPRPNMISRCNPDQSLLASSVRDTYALGFPQSWSLFDTSICRPKSKDDLNEGFKSFPSGHSAVSFSGLFYLTLFLCSKLSIFIPHLHPRPFYPRKIEDGTGRYPNPDTDTADKTEKNDADAPLYHSPSQPDLSHFGHSPDPAAQGHTSRLSVNNGGGPFVTPLWPSTNNNNNGRTAPLSRPIRLRSQGAHPPTYLIILAAIPTIAALYISSTRFIQYDHFGTDILAGAILGIVSAWFSFRWHHLPLSTGAGWAWGPRSANSAFGVGVGASQYVDYDLPESDLEYYHAAVVPGSAATAINRGNGNINSCDRDSGNTHPAYREPMLEVYVPASPGRASIAHSTRNSIYLPSEATRRGSTGLSVGANMGQQRKSTLSEGDGSLS